MTFTIILPERNTDGISKALRELTEVLGPDTNSFGIVGGRYGYGTHYEDDTILMRPFCWCEEDTCPWCVGCTCPASAFHYYVDGVEVPFDAWVAFYFQYVYGTTTISHDIPTPPDYDQRVATADARRTRSHDAICPYCAGTSVAAPYAPAGHSAPNFWHKPSGLRVWWYKYIGRSMEVLAPEGVDAAQVLADVLAQYRRAR